MEELAPAAHTRIGLRIASTIIGALVGVIALVWIAVELAFGG